jgi:hypothetical protein
MKLPDGDDSDRPAYSQYRVDLMLIRWMLSLTPAERLATLQQICRFRTERPCLEL